MATATIQPTKIDFDVKSISLTPTPERFTGKNGEELNETNVEFDPEILRDRYLLEVDLEQVKEKHGFRRFEEAQPLKLNDVPTISLDSIDLSRYVEGPEGLESRLELAAQLEKSISTYGFFNVINCGISKQTFDKVRSIAQSILELPDLEKLEHLAGARQTDLENKSLSLGGERGAGFKPKGYWSMQNGVRDSIEHYNFRDLLHDDYLFDKNRRYPEIARAFLPEVSLYYRHIHFIVLRKLCNLCDIILQLPEGYLWNNFFKVFRNDLMNSGSGYGRFMHYLGMKKQDEQLTNKTWLRGHSDSCGFTFITSQPILSLQIRDYYTGEWKYVGHKPDSLIVNIGDAMEFITGGYFKSLIHRVISPPDDQKQFKRLVLIYFCDPKLNSVLDPESLGSEKLDQLGFTRPEEWDKITFAHWVDEKGRLFGRKDLNLVAGDEPKVIKVFGRQHERWHQVSDKQKA